MRQHTILMLEDDEDGVRGFQSAVASLGHDFGVRIWTDAPTLIAEGPACFAGACLISLDHDLQARAGEADQYQLLALCDAGVNKIALR